MNFRCGRIFHEIARGQFAACCTAIAVATDSAVGAGVGQIAIEQGGDMVSCCVVIATLAINVVFQDQGDQSQGAGRKAAVQSKRTHVNTAAAVGFR